jgi:PhnB protein
MKLRTYLNYGGNCAEAFRFYEEHLGGKIGMMMTYDQMQGQSDMAMQMKGKVLHASITIGDTVLMASDVPPDRFQPVRSVYIRLNVESDAEAERTYELLTDGGEVFMPMGQTFFATRFGQFRDQFGTSWMVTHEKPMGPPRP